MSHKLNRQLISWLIKLHHAGCGTQNTVDMKSYILQINEKKLMEPSGINDEIKYTQGVIRMNFKH